MNKPLDQNTIAEIEEKMSTSGSVSILFNHCKNK
jgi:hypothetical protein